MYLMLTGIMTSSLQCVCVVLCWYSKSLKPVEFDHGGFINKGNKPFAFNY